MPGVAAVLLAAGESARMKTLKALLPWQQGLSILASQVHALYSAGYAPIIVVLGHEASRLRDVVPALPGVSVVENPRYKEGRATSVVRGVREVPADAEGVLIASVDQPRPTDMLRTLREAFQRAHEAFALPVYEGRSGHPPLFSGSLLPELLAVTEERMGLREVISAHHEERLLVPVNTPLALTNLNTQEDYEAALKWRD
jgi:molybdenum cofactor cytidylyltransferase